MGYIKWVDSLTKGLKVLLTIFANPIFAAYRIVREAFAKNWNLMVWDIVFTVVWPVNWVMMDPVDSTPYRSTDAGKSVEKPYTDVDPNGYSAETSAQLFKKAMSWFRYYGYTSMPKYVFGTDGVGHDYFKVLFSGLRTSLALGALTAIITISFGIVWGSISGYFGGWTDILMERFTEILGGVPWIVMVELATSDELFRHPLHPYTKALLSAIPRPDPLSEKNRVRIVYNPSKAHDGLQHH